MNMSTTIKDHDGLLECALKGAVKACKDDNQCFAAFSAIQGELWNGDLMLIGRAVNDWGSHEDVGVLRKDDGIKALVEDARAEAWGQDGSCPLQLVIKHWSTPEPTSGYRFVRSAFWRTGKTVIEGLQGSNFDPDRWVSHLTWSNLYKVALSASDGRKAGNPGAPLQRAQRDACIKLLRQELQQFKPKRVLFLTGQDWADPFLQEPEVDNWSSSKTELVQSFGKLKVGDRMVDFVVAKHPQGKPETKLACQVLKSFEKLKAG
jgi:hypothetical protein